ncbi:hypothetical protein SM007_34275 [Streptomyces avermitilis]|uniref:Uncharacterized protein n=1 Tax=Streptomyces avermitilis TaxID=33903 RepID=A0A4D4M963_STRAX|nr:hypothetical protein SM007_34275 [Streptomyces avermitilis]GDY68385.1 hypothetical protein SAV14893_077780 [Streptomyces avermitilis]
MKRAFLDGRDAFDPVDAFLLRTIGDRAEGRAPGEPPCPWEELYDRAERRGVTHLFRASDLARAGAGADVAEPYTAARRLSKLIAKNSVGIWSEVARAFDAHGLRIAGLRGPFLNGVLGRPLDEAPTTAALDLVADRETLPPTVALLESLGFVQGLGIRDRRFYRLGRQGVRDLEDAPGSYGRIAPMARLLELPELDQAGNELERSFARRQLVRTANGVRCLSSIDLHFDLGYRDEEGEHSIPARDLLDRTVSSGCLGTELRAVDLVTHTWLLAYRTCLDSARFGERRFELLADVAVLLRRGGWSRDLVEEAYRTYPFIEAPVAATLEFLATECGVELLATAPRRPARATGRTASERDPGGAALPDTVNPDRANPRGLILVCHGWDTTLHSSPLVRRLRAKEAGKGVDVVEVAPFTDPDPTDVSRVAARLAAHIRAARRGVPDLPVALLGVSLGSSAAITAVLDGAEADVLVTVGTCLSADIAMPEGPERILERHPESDDSTLVPFLSRTARLGFLRDLADSAPLHRLADLRTPTLVLEGGKDNPWRRRDGETLRAHTEKLRNGSRFRSFPAGGHTLDDTSIGAAAEIVDWLDSVGFHPRLPQANA